MMSECVHYKEFDRRLTTIETAQTVQTDENAKLWKAMNLIREEKARDSVTLETLVASVDSLRVQMTAGFKELRDEIDKLKAIPAKRWENLVSDVLKEVVALTVGIIVTYLAIKGGP